MCAGIGVDVIHGRLGVVACDLIHSLVDVRYGAWGHLCVNAQLNLIPRVVDVQYLYGTFSGRSVQALGHSVFCRHTNRQCNVDISVWYNWNSSTKPIRQHSLRVGLWEVYINEGQNGITTHYMLSIHTRFLVMVDTNENSV